MAASGDECSMVVEKIGGLDLISRPLNAMNQGCKALAENCDVAAIYLAYATVADMQGTLF